jgi:hypothetical protein
MDIMMLNVLVVIKNVMIDDVMVLDCFNVYNALIFELINLIYAIIMIDADVSIDASGRA